MQHTYHIDSGNPNGYITAQAPAMCYTKAGGLWAKTNDLLDNSGWICLIQDEVITP